MSEVVSLSDVRFRAHQDGDIPTGGSGPGAIPDGSFKLYIDNIKFRSEQDVQFSDDITAATRLDMRKRAAKRVYGTVNKKAIEPDWTGYGTPIVWAYFSPEYTGEYELYVEVVDGHEGFTPNIEIWEVANQDPPESYGDVLDFTGFAWSNDFPEPEFADLDKDKWYYILAYHWGTSGIDPEIEGTFSFTMKAADQSQYRIGAISGGPLLNPRGWQGGHNSTENGPVTILHNIFVFHNAPLTIEVERCWGGLIPRLRVETSGGVLITQDEGVEASVTFTPNGTSSYRLEVEGVDGTEGGYIIKWDMPHPPGDSLDNPIDLGSSNSISRTGDSTHGASSDVLSTPGLRGEEDVFTEFDGDWSSVWYTWTCADDGWLYLSIPAKAVGGAWRIDVFQGNDYEDLLLVEKGDNFSPYNADLPVKAGQVYKIRVNSFGLGSTFSFNMINNTSQTPINFFSGSEFSHTTIGSFTSFDIYSSTNPYGTKTLLTAFKVKFGNANEIVGDGGDDKPVIGRMVDWSGTTRDIALDHSARNMSNHNNIFFGSISGDNVNDDEWTLVEIFWNTHGGVDLYTNGKYIGTPFNFGAVAGIRRLDLGYISDSLSRGLDMRFKDVTIKDLHNRDFNYLPEELPNRIIHFEGFNHNLGRTVSSVYDDWSGYGGAGDTFQALRNLQAPNWLVEGDIVDDPERGRCAKVTGIASIRQTGMQDTNLNICHSVSAWVKPKAFTTAPTWQILCHIDGNGLTKLLVRHDGNLKIQNVIEGTEFFLKRKLTLEEWTCLEFVYDNRWPKTKHTVYINGELVYDDYAYRWEDWFTTTAPWVHFTGGGTGAEMLWTDLAVGLGYQGKLGAFKTAQIVPNSTVDDSIGTLGGAWPGHSYAWIKSSDDGITFSAYNTGDGAHNYVNSWPFARGFNTSPNAAAKWIAQTNGTGFSIPHIPFYIEFGFEDMPSGTPVALKTREVGRGAKMIPEPPNPSVYESERAPELAVYTTATIMNGVHELRTVRKSLACSFELLPHSVNHYEETRPFAGGINPWTESQVNGITVRWGSRGGGFAFSHEYGTVLQALAIEVLMEDNYPALAEYANLDAPWSQGYLPTIYWEWEVQGVVDLYEDGEIPADQPLTGCDAYGKRTFPRTFRNGVFKSKVVDPYIRGKTPVVVTWFENEERNDVEIYWRVLPAFDLNYPGFDGDFHDTETDRINGTTSANMLRKWARPSGYDWWENNYGGQRAFAEYPPHEEIYKTYPEQNPYVYITYCNIDHATMLYDACRDRGGKLNPDGTIVLEAYVRDQWGNTSELTQVTIRMVKDCCGSIVLPIKFRAFQAGDMNAEEP